MPSSSLHNLLPQLSRVAPFMLGNCLTACLSELIIGAYERACCHCKSACLWWCCLFALVSHRRVKLRRILTCFSSAFLLPANDNSANYRCIPGCACSSPVFLPSCAPFLSTKESAIWSSVMSIIDVLFRYWCWVSAALASSLGLCLSGLL